MLNIAARKIAPAMSQWMPERLSSWAVRGFMSASLGNLPT
jgi:hypothetical protein